MNIKELIALMQRAILVMQNKQKMEPEDIVNYFIDVYMNTLIKIQRDESFTVDLIRIKSFTRIYLETSSNYIKSFLIRYTQLKNM